MISDIIGYVHGLEKISMMGRHYPRLIVQREIQIEDRLLLLFYPLFQFKMLVSFLSPFFTGYSKIDALSRKYICQFFKNS